MDCKLVFTSLISAGEYIVYLSLSSENKPWFLIVLRIFKANPPINRLLYVVLVKFPHHEAKLMFDLHTRLVSAGQTSWRTKTS